MEFDYKKILIAYRTHISNMEGINYVTDYEDELKELGLSEEEIKELENLTNE